MMSSMCASKTQAILMSFDPYVFRLATCNRFVWGVATLWLGQTSGGLGSWW